MPHLPSSRLLSPLKGSGFRVEFLHQSDGSCGAFPRLYPSYSLSPLKGGHLGSTSGSITGLIWV